MIYIVIFLCLTTSHVVTSESNNTNVDVQFKFVRDLCAKIHVTSSVDCCRVNKAVLFIGYTALAVVVGFIAVPLLFCICGFRRIGVRGGSYAADFQSLHGTPRPFSCLQSLSMTGILCWIVFIGILSYSAIKIFYWNQQCT